MSDEAAVNVMTEWINEVLRQRPDQQQSATLRRRKQKNKHDESLSVNEYPVAVATFACGTGVVRGMTATRDVAAGAVLLRIPYGAFLTADAALRYSPSLEVAVRDIEASQKDRANPVLDSMPNAVSVLHSCETVIAWFLIIQRYGDAVEMGEPLLPPGLRAFVDLLPSLDATSTPEMLFLIEFDECPLDYIAGDSDVERLKASLHRSSKCKTEDEMIRLLGSKLRWAKLRRRVERQFVRYQQLVRTYLTPRPGLQEASHDWLLRVRPLFTFSRWLWATHMVNSRTFMYRRPSWSDYPVRYEAGYTGAAAQDAADTNDDASSSDDDAGIMKAIEDAKCAHRAALRSASGNDKNEGAANVATTEALQRRAVEALRQDDTRRSHRIGGHSAALSSDDDSDDGTTSSSSESDRGSKEADLLAMVPFADMLNHCAQNGTADFTFDRVTCDLVIRADKPVFRGEQVFLRYNGMDHWRFAKYYGFVPGVVVGITSTDAKQDLHARNVSSSQTGSYAADAFPIVPPPPPTASCRGDSGIQSSILAITKSQLFEGKSLKRHCYVTCSGPNQQLRSVLRLAFLGPKELANYVAAYEKEPLSIRNEWQVYEFLKHELTSHKKELERNAVRCCYTSANSEANGSKSISSRAHTALCVRERDLQVVTAALAKTKAVFEDLCGLLYYGTATSAALRSNAIHSQFKKLKELGRLPQTEEEQRKAGLTLLPRLFPVDINARDTSMSSSSTANYVDAVFDQLQTHLKEQRAALKAQQRAAHVDAVQVMTLQ